MPNLDSLKNIINYRLIFFITVVAFLSLSVLNLIGTNALATQGFAVNEFETKTLALEKENQILSVKIEEATQLRSLEKLAEGKGYIRTGNIVFKPTAPSMASR